MACKRMFDKAIIDTDKFMDLPMSSKALYFLLGMEADDEGFVSHKKVLRIHGGSDDDVKVLIAKNFLISFPTGVVVITDWQKNNYLNKERIKETEYQNEKKLLSTKNGRYYIDPEKTDVKQMLNECSTSIEENSIVENSNISEPSSPMNKFSLIEKMGMKPKSKLSAYQWQDEAAAAIKFLNTPPEKKSSVFKCFKENNTIAKFALSDCKELKHPQTAYFLKIYNIEVKKHL